MPSGRTPGAPIDFINGLVLPTSGNRKLLSYVEWRNVNDDHRKGVDHANRGLVPIGYKGQVLLLVFGFTEPNETRQGFAFSALFEDL